MNLPMADHSSLLALEGVLEGASRIGKDFGSKRTELVVDEKSAGQFASNADFEIEKFIRDQLIGKFPGDSIVGEELGGDLGSEVTGWAIDPIDGTSNFVLGLPIWGISVGYLENGKSMVGCIALPDLQLVVSGLRAHGVRVNGKPLRARKMQSEVRILAVGENDYETVPQTDARAQAFREVGYSVVRYRSAVFALAMSALGRLSGYVESGCCIWDIAAAEVICREAGMRVDASVIAEGRHAIDARWNR